MAHQRGSAASIPNDKANVSPVKHKYYRERKIIKTITILSSVLIIVGMSLSIVFINIFSHVEFMNESSAQYVEDKILDYCFKDKKPIAIKKIIGSDLSYCSNSVTPFSNEDVYKFMRKISWERYSCFQNLVIYSSFSDDGGGCIDSENVGGIILMGPSLYIFRVEN